MPDVPQYLSIDAGKPTTTDFIVGLPDPLFTQQTDQGLCTRAFDALEGRAISLLCTNASPPDAYTATYSFELGEAFRGTLWVYEQGRLWASPFEWRIDNGPWHAVNIHGEMFRGGELADNGPTFSWCRAGKTEIGAGTHTLSVRVITPKEDGSYLLAQDRFVFVPLDAPSGDYLEAFPWTPARRDDEKELPTKRSIFVWGDSIPDSPISTGFQPWIEPYPVRTNKPMGAVLVIPGGAYRFRAPYEGSDVARAFNEAGFHAFVLQYRVFPHTREEALADGQRAMRMIRSRAAEWNVDPEKIAACGFSAGAHLSGSLGMLQLSADVSSDDPVLRCHSRPDALILCYPPAYDAFDVRTRGMPENFPPAFVWHTVADEMVSVDNSLAIAAAMRARNVSFEMHLYPEGRHGLGLSAENAHVASWFRLCCEWLEGLGWRG
jgi:acetyl esterase/lipase